MSKLAKQVIQLLADGPLTVYELAELLGRTPAGTKTLIFEMRKSGYISRANENYPARYEATEKASEPIKIEWKGKRAEWQRQSRAKPKGVAQSAIDLAIQKRPTLQTVWGM